MIPLSVPNISVNEWEYVKDCLDTAWISSSNLTDSDQRQLIAEIKIFLNYEFT